MGRPRGGGGGGGKGKGPPGANLFIACKGGTFQGLSDESLHMAFARFGEIVRCEVTIDRNTGELRKLRDSRCVPPETRPVRAASRLTTPLLAAPRRSSPPEPRPVSPRSSRSRHGEGLRVRLVHHARRRQHGDEPDAGAADRRAPNPRRGVEYVKPRASRRRRSVSLPHAPRPSARPVSARPLRPSRSARPVPPVHVLMISPTHVPRPDRPTAPPALPRRRRRPPPDATPPPVLAPVRPARPARRQRPASPPPAATRSAVHLSRAQSGAELRTTTAARRDPSNRSGA